MESRGLTPTVVREIVDGINEKSNQHFRENFPQKACKGKIGWIQLGVLLMGVLIMIDVNSTHIWRNRIAILIEMDLSIASILSQCFTLEVVLFYLHLFGGYLASPEGA